MKKRLIGLISGLIILILFCILPAPEGLGVLGMRALGIFLCALIWFCTQVAPMSVICLGIMVANPWFGIGNLSQVWADFGGASFFFLLFTFALMNALTSTTIPKRIVTAILKLSKGNSVGIVWGVFIVAGLISAFMTNFGTLLIVLSVVSPLLKGLNCQPGKSNLGRCIYLGLPLVCCVGGLMTPAGMPGNLITMSFVASAGYPEITFLDWTRIFAPLGLVSLVAICLIFCALFKPEKLDNVTVQNFIEDSGRLGPMTRNEKLIVAIYVIVIVCWFASTWVPVLNTAAVAGIATLILFLPGLDLLSWKKFAAETNWDILFVVGSVAVALGGVTSTGAFDWLIKTLLGGVAGWSPFVVFFVVGIVVFIIRACVPTGPAVPAILCPIMVTLAQLSGVSVVALCMLPIISASYPLLLTYTEPIYLATMSEGYYKPFDLDKFGIIFNLVLIAVCGLYLPMVF